MLVGELADDILESFWMSKILWEHDLIKKRVTRAVTKEIVTCGMVYPDMLQIVLFSEVFQKVPP